MLEGLRAVQNTWVGKAIIGAIMVLIVVSFAFFGMGDVFRGFNANQVAQVGDVKITTAAYRQAYQVELETLQQRAKRAITNAEAHRIGLDAQVLSRLISNAVLDDRARGLALAISDPELRKAITDDPAFAGPGGNFERARYDAVLRNSGYSEQSFEREQRRVYLRQELIQALVGGMGTPKAVAEALHRYQGETRSLDLILLPAAAAGPPTTPDAAALQSYFDAHAASLAAPEYRKLTVLALTPAILARPDDVSETDARALYDQVKEVRFGSPERRTLQQIVFPSDADAGAASARIKAGTTFADIASERKIDAASRDLGTLGKEQLFDRAVADAAFALPAGGTSDVVKGAFGPVLVHVVDIAPGGTKPFEEVAGAVKTEIATRRAGDRLRTLHDAVEDARSSGQPLAEAARATGVAVTTIDAVDASGLDKSGRPVNAVPERDGLLKAAFASDVGVDNDTVQTRDGGTIWFEVAGIERARPRTLAEVKDQVEAGWRIEDNAKRLAARADDLVKALDAGKSLEEIAAGLGGLTVTHVGDAKRSGASGLAPGVSAAAFEVPVGRAGSAASGPDGRAVFKVLDSVTPPLDPESPEAVQANDRYRDLMSDDILGLYLAKVGAKLGAKVNQDAVRAAVGGS